MNINSFQSLSKAGKNISLFAGLNLIILSIIIFVFPEILAYAVAALFFLVGISLVGFGMRKSSKRNTQKQTEHQETVYYTL
jgi:uncharacterized membrane protein YesL